MLSMNQVRYQIQWPPFSKSVIGLAAFFFVFWLATVLSEPLRELVPIHFAVSFDAIKDLRIWTLVTYGLWHQSFFEVLFTSIALWLFGGELQSRYGLKTWWGMLIAATLLGGLFVVALGALFPPQSAGGFLTLFEGGGVSGMHAAVMAFVTAYCIGYWNRSLNFFFVPMTGKTMLLFFVGLSFVFALIGSHYNRLVLDTAGILVGVIVAKRLLNIRDLRTRFAMWRARRHLKLVRTPEEHGYMNGAGKRKKNGPERPN